MLKTLRNFKNELSDSSGDQNRGWFASFFSSLDSIVDKLKKARTDTEKIKIYEELIQAQQQEIERLVSENNELKDEDLESIVSSESASSSGSINTQIQKRKARILKKQQTSKASTASDRREIKYLTTIERLKEENNNQALRIKELEQPTSNDSLLVSVLRDFDRLDQSVNRTHALIEVKK